jgi:hypothetical protein
MKTLTTTLCLTIAVLLGSVGVSFALPECPAERNRTNSPWSNCFGTITYADGDKYVGEYKDNKRNGQGAYTFASGDKYVGEYKDDKRNGQGAYTFASGDKYVGEYKDGKYNGQGTYTLADGNKYVGEFKDGKENGQGSYMRVTGHTSIHAYTLADGREESIWKNDEFQYAQKGTPPVIARKSSPPSPSAAPLGYSSVDYWMSNNPEVVKGWRHYMHVANFWLKSEEERALILAKTRNQSFKAVSADSGENSGGTQVAARKAKRKAAVVTYNSYHVDAENNWPLGNSTQARPSDRWKKSATRLRKLFQRHIRAYGNL